MNIHVLLLLLAAAVANGAPRAHRGSPKFPVCGVRHVRWSPRREARIIGGEVPPHGAVPWQVDLRVDGKHRCGGALVGVRLVLTAAHCFADALTATIGKQSVRVQRAIVHDAFRLSGPYSNDIALLLLDAPGLQYDALVQPACLAAVSPAPGTWCEVSGWGAVDARDPERLSPVLRAAAVPLLSLDVCRKSDVYGGRQQQILDTMLCAGRLKGGVDACGGDSGGPLVCDVGGRMQLAGIVSWGDGCAKKDRPGVYTRIANYLVWIRQAATDLHAELD